MCARTLCPFVSSTRNIAFGRASTTEPSISMTPSFLAIASLSLGVWDAGRAMMLHAVAVRLTPSDRASGMPKRACRAPRVYFRRFGAISPVEPAARAIPVLTRGCGRGHLVDEAVFERMSRGDAHDLVHDLHGPAC